MARFRFLLSPGWLALLLGVIAFAFACFYILAPWQLGKSVNVNHRNDQIRSSLAQEPVAIHSFINDHHISSTDQWRNVLLSGKYLDDEVLITYRTNNEQPTYEVIAPFQLESGEIIFVNRGWIPIVEQGQQLKFSSVPQGQVNIRGYTRQSETLPENKPPTETFGYPQVSTINSEQLISVLHIPEKNVTDGYVQLTNNQPGSLGDIALPRLESGPHFSYGLQWIAFGILAPFALIYFARMEWLARKHAKAEQTGVENTAGNKAKGPLITSTTQLNSRQLLRAALQTPPNKPSVKTEAKSRTSSLDDTSQAEPHVSQKLAERYGRSR